MRITSENQYKELVGYYLGDFESSNNNEGSVFLYSRNSIWKEIWIYVVIILLLSILILYYTITDNDMKNILLGFIPSFSISLLFYIYTKWYQQKIQLYNDILDILKNRFKTAYKCINSVKYKIQNNSVESVYSWEFAKETYLKVMNFYIFLHGTLPKKYLSDLKSKDELQKEYDDFIKFYLNLDKLYHENNRAYTPEQISTMRKYSTIFYYTVMQLEKIILKIKKDVNRRKYGKMKRREENV